MLKNYLFIFIFLISFSGLSQSFNIYSDFWRLQILKIDGQEYRVNYPDEKKTDDNGNYILLKFYESPNPNFDTYICNVKDGFFTLDEANNKLTILSTGTTLETCSNLGDPDFEVLYFSFFQDSTVYDYTLSPPNLDIPGYFLITAPNGNTAYYGTNYLSSNNLTKLAFSIYPNPVKDKLFVSSANNLNNYNVEIFDVLGKLKISEQLKSNSIIVEHLPKGVYFLMIRDRLGNRSTTKFVK
ncbi:T9SS type A sorting domain-containing protein [Flavobacteriaceae bacterium SZ-1-7]|uniref:T9SS type A sorting domain-containing protein n=1 Tax=Tamlana sedimenti TaxID=3134126 RepID=UPI0031257942